MERNEKLERFVEITNKMKELEAEKKELQLELLMDIGDEPVMSEGGYKVTRTIRRTFTLKEEVNIEDVQKEFPEAVKLAADMEVLKATPDAHKYLDLKSSEYLTVGKPKK